MKSPTKPVGPLVNLDVFPDAQVSNHPRPTSSAVLRTCRLCRASFRPESIADQTCPECEAWSDGAGVPTAWAASTRREAGS